MQRKSSLFLIIFLNANCVVCKPGLRGRSYQQSVDENREGIGRTGALCVEIGFFCAILSELTVKI